MRGWVRELVLPSIASRFTTPGAARYAPDIMWSNLCFREIAAARNVFQARYRNPTWLILCRDLRFDCDGV
ncbi:hypothetical protein LAUMK35_02565 [Mycobacterium pseudokansasii]|uniref:Uncharacterized protein n=1 Tax=Mycobacterium pseudokansasii TaxID=2341080 RepID=A0A498QW14_9MYCO|nr:hypothetical protein LAUMK35_02565 [Mycobacterium pseudokansasii]VAZ95269.1 hypothetical protein LAUMK21_02565 [Mycobacterium pseudokansasii]VBA50204.1 hypothetical protein LAUMK142_02457 [Mycobacterium pseudokansasii]